MATNGSRDVKLSLSIETLGEEGINGLRDALRQLAKSGGDAAPEFQKLADEVDRLGGQADALRSFQSLSDTVRQLGVSQSEAAKSTAELKARLDSAGESVQRAAADQAELKARLQEANAALAQTKGDLTILRNTYDESGKRVANYKSELERLTREKVAQSAVVAKLREEMRESNATVRDAESAESKAQAAYQKSEKTLASLNKTLEARRAELKQQESALSGLGVETNNLAQSQATLISAINGTGAAASRLKAELEAARAAEQRMAEQNAKAVADNAERIRSINDEIKYRQQLASQREALARQTANAEAAAAAEAVAAQKRARAEEQSALAQKLADLNTQIKYIQQQAAQRAAIASEAVQKEIEAEKQGAKEREAAAKAASDAISNAFRTTGAKSAVELRQQIDAVKGAMRILETQAGLTGEELKVAMAAGTSQIRSLERELRAATNQMTLADRASGLLKNSLGQIAAGNLIADGVGYLVEKVKALGREFFTANIQAEGMTRALNAVYRDTSVTANQMAFLNETANKAGISVSGISSDFVKFSAAMQSSNIPLEQSNALFTAVTQAAGTLGLGADKVSGALNALGQIASKGVVSMEELRQQLGDALPGALSLTAQGMGITDAALIKLVESGKLASSTFIPAFTDGLKSLAGENDTLQGSIARLSNATNAFFRAIGDAGVLTVLKAGLAGVTEVAKGLYTAFGVLTEGFFSVGRAVGAVVGAFATGQSVLEAATSVFNEMNARVEVFVKTLYGSADAAQEAQAKLDALTTANAANVESSVLAERSLIKLNAALLEQKTLLEQRTAAAERDVKISELQATNMNTLAKLSGDLSVAFTTEAEAANLSLDKKQQLVAAIEQEIDFYKQSLEAVQILMSQKSKLTEADAKQIAEMKKEIEVREQAVAKAKEQAEASRLVALQAGVEAEKHRDNSARLQELKQTYESAQAALNLLIEAESKGVDVSVQKKVALENLRVAQALYNDALSDNAAKLQANNIALKADYELRVSSLELLKANYVAMEKNALAMGNEYQARQARISQLKIDIELTKAKVAFMEAEAKGSIAVANAKLEELKASNQLTPLKQAELEASIKMAEAKIMEAKAIGTSVQELERQLTALRNGTAAINDHNQVVTRGSENMIRYRGSIMSTSDALELMGTKYKNSSQYTERQIELLSQEIDKRAALLDLKEKEDAFERRRKNVDKDGFSLDSNGNRMTATIITPQSAFNDAKSMGLDDAAALRISDYYAAMAKSDPRLADISAFYGLVNDAKLKAARRATGVGTVAVGGSPQAAAPASSIPGGVNTTQSTSRAPAPASTGRATTSGSSASMDASGTSTVKTYNVTIGNSTVRTASDRDAQILIDVLKKASLTQ